MKAAAFYSVALCLSAVTGACASQPEPSGAVPGATLEVVNRTAEDLTIAVRGRVELTLRAQTRARVRDLVPGPADVLAREVPAGPGAFEARQTFAFERGQTTLWTIVPDAAGGEPLAEPPPFGTLVVHNTTPNHVLIALGGQSLGRVFAGATRTFVDITAGTYEVVARPDGDGRGQPGSAGPSGGGPRILIEGTVAIAADAETSWQVATAGLPIVVRNQTDETLVVSLDGAEIGTARAGAEWRGVMPFGTHLLEARSEPSRRPYERTLTVSPPPSGEPIAEVTWDVTAGQASLVVANRTGEPVSVEVLDRPPVAADSGADAILGDVPTGPVAIRAVGQKSGLTYAGRVDLGPGQRGHWIAEPIAGSVRVVNRTDRVLWLYIKEGRDPERHVGELQPGQPTLIRDLPRQSIALAAVDPIGARRYETTLDLSELPADTWSVHAETGSLTITNERDEPVAIYVDALRVGEVPAHDTRTFPGLAVGRRLVEAVGQRTGYVQTHDAGIVEERSFAVKLADPTAYVAVSNMTGEVLATRGALAEQHTNIPKGGAGTFRVREGGMRLTLVGEESGLVYQHELEAKAGEPAQWNVRRLPATLTVWNRLAETVAVAVDNHAHGSLAPDQTMTISDLVPGIRTLQAVGLASGAVRTDTVLLSPDDEQRVTLDTRLGVLMIENRAAEPVSVTVDGRPYGDVAAGAVHGFANVPPGKHRVGLHYLRSRREVATDLDVREGQRAKVVAETPLAPVVLYNAARQALVVKVDGTPIATVDEDAPPTLLHVPAGPRLVEIERLADHTTLAYRLDFWADTAIHLPVPPKSVRLVVVNRQPFAAEVRNAEHVIGRVEASGSALFEDVASPADLAAPLHLIAKAPDGRVTHTEMREVRAGETATWVLESAP